MSRIRITIHKFDDDSLQPRKPTTLIWIKITVNKFDNDPP